jgi:CubicO group peptidase (beta-lactamase class C family)
VTAPDHLRPEQVALPRHLIVAMLFIAGCAETADVAPEASSEIPSPQIVDAEKAVEAESAADSSSTEEVGPAPWKARVDRLTAAVPDLLAGHDVPGLTLCLIHDGEIVWNAGFGERRSSDGAPMLEDTILEGAGLALPMIAHAALQLEADQVLDLDRPLADVLPLFGGDDPRVRNITARMLLSHSSGLSAGPPDRSSTLDTQPGRSFQVSSEGQRLLQRALEHVTDETLDVMLERLVFGPLGMRDTSMVWRLDYDERASAGHELPGRLKSTVRRKQRPSLADAPTSLHTTAPDVARFVIAALARQRQFAPAAGVEIDSELGLSFGSGWALETGPGGVSVFQWGSNPFFRAFVLFTPADGHGLVVLSNCVSGMGLMPDLVAAYDGLEHDLFQSPLLHLDG